MLYAFSFGHQCMNKFLSVVMSLAMLLGACLGACAQTDSTQITIERNHEDIGTFSPEPFPSGTLALPRHLPMKQYNPDGKGTWDVDRPLSIYEILARDRQLILTRMMLEDPTPEFMKDILDNHSIWGMILIHLLGLLNIGGPLGNMDMLVTPVSVGGQPVFDDMIFLDPNFDPRVYQPSLPVPQYDPLDPSQPYKASIRKNGTSSEKGGNASGPPPVQQSKYVIP